MAYLLSNLIADAVRYQGIDAFDIRVATGGSSTTILEDTTLEDKYGDDDLKEGSVVVLRTASSIPPIGEFSRISAYSEEDMQATIVALTAPILSGSTCMIISSDYPLRVLIELANDALRDCGEINYIDTNTVTVEGALEYTLTSSWKHLVQVHYQDFLSDIDANNWIPVRWKRIIPSSANVDATIEFYDAFPAGHSLQFVYNGIHPTVSVYNSPIDESISPSLISLMLADKIMQWFGVTDENRNYANKIIDELRTARLNYPVARLKRKDKFLVWGAS